VTLAVFAGPTGARCLRVGLFIDLSVAVVVDTVADVLRAGVAFGIGVIEVVAAAAQGRMLVAIVVQDIVLTDRERSVAALVARARVAVGAIRRGAAGRRHGAATAPQIAVLGGAACARSKHVRTESGHTGVGSAVDVVVASRRAISRRATDPSGTTRSTASSASATRANGPSSTRTACSNSNSTGARTSVVVRRPAAAIDGTGPCFGDRSTRI
jgi:hypothetical protein